MEPATWEPNALYLQALLDVLVPRGLLLRTLSQAITDQQGMTQKQRWRSIRGPMGALVATLHRIDWNPVAPTVWEDHSGKRYDLCAVEPFVVKQAILASI